MPARCIKIRKLRAVLKAKSLVKPDRARVFAPHLQDDARETLLDETIDQLLQQHRPELATAAVRVNGDRIDSPQLVPRIANPGSPCQHPPSDFHDENNASPAADKPLDLHS